MAKLDTSAIVGFDTMTAEEKLEALLGMDIPDPVDMSKFIEKVKFDKLASEHATAKKRIAESMSEDERVKEETAKAQKELQDKYDALLKESTITKYVARYVAQGYPEELATKTATALFSGDTETVFKNGEAFRDMIAKNAKADALKDTPRPPASEGSGENKLSTSETIAQNIGRATAEANKVANDVMAHYL